MDYFPAAFFKDGRQLDWCVVDFTEKHSQTSFL